MTNRIYTRSCYKKFDKGQSTIYSVQIKTGIDCVRGACVYYDKYYVNSCSGINPDDLKTPLAYICKNYLPTVCSEIFLNKNNTKIKVDDD